MLRKPSGLSVDQLVGNSSLEQKVIHSARSHADAKESLELGGLGFPVCHDGFDLNESGFFEHGGEIALGKPEPAVGVEFAGLFKIVLQEIEHDQSAAGFKDAEGGVDRTLGVLGVVEGLAEDREVEASVVDGWVFDVADPVF